LIPLIITLSLELGVILTFIIPILFVPLILNLYCCFKLKMDLIKDKFKERITVIDKYFLCFNKRYNFSLEYTDFIFIKQTIHCGNFLKSAILIMNIDPNLGDLDDSNIRNRPFKFIYKFTNLMFDENSQLEKNLENIFEHKFKNKIIDEINLYVPKQNEDNDNFVFENSIKKNNEMFVKISQNFYMFYNYNYSTLAKSNESFERLDWIYSKNFDRFFFGVVKNDSSYVNTFIYNTNEIDKFILEIKDDKYCFKIVLKGGVNTEICQYKNEKEDNLNIFIYLINGQLNKINNDNQVTPGNSFPTIE